MSQVIFSPPLPQQRPIPPDPCPVCKTTGLVNRDGTERVLSGASSSLKEIVAKFKPCPFCKLGERESAIWKTWRLLSTGERE
jgi:hypothetical protein